jgi:hypothetical protein
MLFALVAFGLVGFCLILSLIDTPPGTTRGGRGKRS